MLDLPALPGDDKPHQPWLAVTAAPWPGSLTLWRRQAGGYAAVASANARAAMGVLLDPLPPGPIWRFDRAAAARVQLMYGALDGVTEDAVLDGANLAALQHPNGACEIIQFCAAALVAPKTYRLSGFLRGQGGTEELAALALPAGAAFVLINAALAKIPLGLGDIGRPIDFRLTPASVSYDDDSHLSLSVTGMGTGLVPLAPVGAAARRGAAGVTITCIRRTRIDGDSWELAEIPLGEDSEAYQLDILRAGAVVRSLTSAAPSFFYAAADETADFGAANTSLDVVIRQASMVAGLGKPLFVTLPVL